MPGDSSSRWRSGEASAIWMLWITYGSFYFCRANIAAAVPGIEAELELDKAEIGTILASLKLAYAAGQFLNGQLSERVRPRILLAVGMFTSAALSALFGIGTGFYFFLFTWAANGYFQALGWTPCMRIAANWFSPDRRGRAIGIIGTGYQVTGALTFVISGMAAEYLGWRGALWVPAILLSISGLHTLIVLREAPGDRPPIAPRAERPSIAAGITDTLANPRLWLLAVALGLLNACRYGFLDWGISHLLEVQSSASVSEAALKYSVLPLGGVLGAYVAGWASDRITGGRRVPIAVALLMVLAALTLAYREAVGTSPMLSIVLLALVGFCIFGPQVLLVGTLPLDLARKGVPAAAVGFVNLMGYVGASAGDVATGRIADIEGWGAALWFWSACAVGAALVLLPLWRTRAREGNE